jgi:ketosteroid isomerase-like protein
MEDALRRASSELSAALVGRDVVAAGALYADDAMLLAPSAALIAGRGDIEAYWRAGVAVGLVGIELTPIDVRVVGAVAVEVGRYELSVGDDGESGKYCVLHRREADGVWRRTVDVFNPDAPTRPFAQEER